MLLRNKKTGEIVDFMIHKYAESSDDGNPVYAPFNGSIEEWEDYAEPKNYWCIDCFSPDGLISEFTGSSSDILENRKSIGNYFLSREKAEKAVEKLKAWKRLKDKGFRFNPVDRYEALGGNGFDIPIIATMPPEAYTDVEVSKDLDLLFGGLE